MRRGHSGAPEFVPCSTETSLSVRRNHSHRDTLSACAKKSALAFPVIAGVIKFGVRGKLHGAALVPDPAIAPLALPVATGVVEFTVCGNRNRSALISDPAISSCAFPVITGVIKFGVLGEPRNPRIRFCGVRSGRLRFDCQRLRALIAYSVLRQ